MPRGGLVAQQLEQVRARADESDAGLLAGPRQRRVFRQKSIARMDGVDALFLRQRDDAVDIQIGLDRAFALADQVGFVGFEAVQAEAVFLRINGHGADAQFIGRAQDADRDFAAVQGEKFTHVESSIIVEHGPASLRSRFQGGNKCERTFVCCRSRPSCC